MIQTWPATLPHPERSTWQVTPQEARRKTQSDAGPPRYRRRFSGVAKMVTMSVILTRSQKAVFDRFFHDDCAEGSLTFYMPDPTTDGWKLLTGDGVPLLTAGGAPILLSARWLCAWGDQLPAETIHGQLEFKKTFSLVVLP
jgi:hypothetical protein